MELEVGKLSLAFLIFSYRCNLDVSISHSGRVIRADYKQCLTMTYVTFRLLT